MTLLKPLMVALAGAMVSCSESNETVVDASIEQPNILSAPLTCELDAGYTTVFAVDRETHPSSGNFSTCTQLDEFERRSQYDMTAILEYSATCPPQAVQAGVKGTPPHQLCFQKDHIYGQNLTCDRCRKMDPGSGI